MTESLLSFFSDRSSSRLVCLLMLNHVLVQQTSMLQTSWVTSLVDIATMGMMVMTHLVKVVHAQLGLHV